MVSILKRTEDTPAKYPAGASGLSAAALNLSREMIWHRIEAYTAHRWTARDVVWVVEGPGEWVPDLTPATVNTVEIWQDDAWVAVTLDPSPLGGYCLPGCGPYRFAASVGSGTVPEPVIEAYRRLAEYMAEQPERQGAGRYSMDLGGLREEFDRRPDWLARAMQNSGAGDLLRPYRRA